MTADELGGGTRGCTGSCRLAERLAIALPDGDVGAADDPGFVAWLLAHAEPAPFGVGDETRYDREVRSAERLIDRGDAKVVGFEPAAVLDEVEAILSPRMHLEAWLTDVLVYETGGRFAPHRDTPRMPEMIGTLVVGLPIAHAGGAFVLDDGRRRECLDWSAARPEHVPWVALFGDVEHAIEEVTAGARVTLVYALVETDRPRADPTWDARRARLAPAIAALAEQAAWPVMIACARPVIVDEQRQPQGIATLRGGDRDVAEALVAAGFAVTVRACVTAGWAYDDSPLPRFPGEDDRVSLERFAQPAGVAAMREMSAATFVSDPEDDDDHDLSHCTLAPYLAGGSPDWVIRANAHASLVREVLFARSGYFGNEAHMANLYMLVAIEVARTG